MAFADVIFTHFPLKKKKLSYRPTYKVPVSTEKITVAYTGG
jgi:hypothetical protein